MKESEETTEQNLKVPLDMAIDVFAIIVKEGLGHEVIEVSENRRTLTVAIQINLKSPRHQKVIQNIQGQLADYNEYRWSENEELNWRES